MEVTTIANKYITVRIVKCSDWEVLYINGEKKDEGHSIRLDLSLFDNINSAISESGSIESIDYGDLWITDEYMEEVGCPDKFEDIPDDVVED